MEAQLVERERMLGELTPWAHANLATDEWWARTYPYWQEIAPGAKSCIEVHLTNHGLSPTSAAVEPVLPDGWVCDSERSSLRVEVPARTDGMVGAFCRVPDGVARAWITAPSDAAAGRYAVPFRLTWDGRYLGQYRHALVDVR